MSQGARGFHQDVQPGYKETIFVNPIQVDGKNPLNVLTHEIGYGKWPGLGRDEKSHTPEF